MPIDDTCKVSMTCDKWRKGKMENGQHEWRKVRNNGERKTKKKKRKRKKKRRIL